MALVLFLTLSLLWPGTFASLPANARKEIVFVISGNGNFGGHPAQIYKFDILNTVADISKQLSVKFPQYTTTAIVWAPGADIFEIVSPMDGYSTDQDDDLSSYLDSKPVNKDVTTSGLAHAMTFAYTRLFSRKSNVSRIVVAITHILTTTQDLEGFIEQCNQLIPFVIAYGWPHQSCMSDFVNRRIAELNAVINYSGLIDRKWAICGADRKQLKSDSHILRGFDSYVSEAIERNKAIYDYCMDNNQLVDIKSIPEFKENPLAQYAKLGGGVVGLLVSVLVIFLVIRKVYRKLTRPKHGLHIVLAEALAPHFALMMAQSRTMCASKSLVERNMERKKSRWAKLTSGNKKKSVATPGVLPAETLDHRPLVVTKLYHQRRESGSDEKPKNLPATRWKRANTLSAPHGGHRKTSGHRNDAEHKPSIAGAARAQIAAKKMSAPNAGNRLSPHGGATPSASTPTSPRTETPR